MTLYKNIFFDLDDTLWDFSENARDAFEETYHQHHYDRYFDSFAHYYVLYEERNMLLWDQYAEGKLSRSELNEKRFSYPLKAVGVDDVELAMRFSETYFQLVPYKKKLVPFAKELLEYLSPKYNLYIISNGFRELQGQKMRSSGIDHYFKDVILSDDVGVMKPDPHIFQFALKAAQSTVEESIMIGDNPVADIQGAAAVGMDQVFFRYDKRTAKKKEATYNIKELQELQSIL